jgi:hypothetical protein
MSDIPQARARLELLVGRLRYINHDKEAAEIVEIMQLLVREKPIKPKTRAKSRPMTSKLGREIRAYARANPNQSHQQIGNVFQINTGRVSEAMHRKW